MSNSLNFKVVSVIALFGLMIATYMLLIRPAQLNWGASDSEVFQPMLGDDLVQNPTYRATRAITIAAQPEDIWPWLVQMGYGKAGFYGYDLIENLGSARGIRSADRIIPELLDLQVGDIVPISPVANMHIHTIDPERLIVWTDDSEPHVGAFTWIIFPVGENSTRLVSRFRFRHRWNGTGIALDLFTDFADHVAIKKILLGIKGRAEGSIEPFATQNLELALWGVAFLELIVAVFAVFKRKAWVMFWFVALAAGGVLLFALYAQPYLWLLTLLETGILAWLVGSFRASRQLDTEKFVSAVSS